jgi:hypothetical protein
MTKRFTFFLFVLAAVSSCTVQKRLYNKGFHVEFHKHLHRSNIHTHAQAIDEPELAENETKEIHSDFSLVQEAQTDGSDSCSDEKIELVAIEQQSPEDADTYLGQSIRKIATQPIRLHFSDHQTRMQSPRGSFLPKSTSTKQQTKKSRDFDRDKFWDWVIILGLTVGAVILLSFIPGVTFLQALLVVLGVIVALYLLALLIGAAFGNFEWFWSGR